MPSRFALFLLFAVLAGSCGGDDEPDDEVLVRETLTTFADAVEKRDYATLCDEVFAPELLEGLQSIGLPCELAMKNSLGEVDSPKLTVGQVRVEKDDATAEIKTSAAGQPPSSNTLHLVKLDGDWRVSDLSESAAGTPAPEGDATAEPEATAEDTPEPEATAEEPGATAEAEETPEPAATETPE